MRFFVQVLTFLKKLSPYGEIQRLRGTKGEIVLVKNEVLVLDPVPTPVAVGALLQKATEGHDEYVKAHPFLNVRTEPLVTEDNKIGWFSYGEKVTVYAEKEGWKEVLYGGIRAWVSAYYVTAELSEVFPTFVLGGENIHRSPNTLMLRYYIEDEFGGDAAGLDLQCTEYVQYKIKKAGVHIAWPRERPRHGGLWASLFRKNGLYTITDVPVKGGAVCLRSGLGGPETNAIGHVAYIEGVLPGGAIRVSEANWPHKGKYNERVISALDLSEKYMAEFVSFS